MKNALTRKIIFILVIAVIVSAFLSVTSIAADTVGATEGLTESSGMDFTVNNSLHVIKDLEQLPRTYEAVIYVPSDSSHEGTIFGNYLNLTLSHINLAINSSGQPKLYIHDTNVKDERQMTHSFGKDVRGGWAHVVITHETAASGDVFTCYVNGELVTSYTTGYTFAESDASLIQAANSFYLGRDFRAESKGYFFNGRINDFALYSSALTADEVKSNFNSGINSTDERLMLYYDLENENVSASVTDASGNGYDLKPILFERERALSDYAYSFAIIGDTQFLVDYDVTNGTSYTSSIFNWIINNKDDKSIARVLGVGDITEDSEAAEWALASGLYDSLTNAGIPYSITWGLGHDAPADFDTYFASKDCFTTSDIGYFSGTSLKNYY